MAHVFGSHRQLDRQSSDSGHRDPRAEGSTREEDGEIEVYGCSHWLWLKLDGTAPLQAPVCWMLLFDMLLKLQTLDQLKLHKSKKKILN